ncbi:MAG: alpha/beta fold hydrolase [Simkania negevensis]|nr:alpha/beta fold hydrolase [Simkania negevensis]
MPFIKANGIQLYYEIEGKGNPLVLISGFATTHTTWDQLRTFLSPSFQLLMLDNRGAGQSESPSPPYQIEVFAKDILSLMDQLKIEKASFIGSSMGTAIVQTFALLHPKRIEKGVLISPFAKLPSLALMKSKTIGKLLKAEVPLALVVETILPMLFSNKFLSNQSSVEKKIKDLTDTLYPVSENGIAGQIAALEAFNLEGKIKDIHNKLLLIAGEEDLSTPLYCVNYLKNHLPYAELALISEVGHMPHIEKASLVAQLVSAFLS